MNKIIDINIHRNKINNEPSFNITKEDLFDLFLIFKSKEEPLAGFDINVLMQSLAKHRNLKKFNLIFKNIVVEKNKYDKEIVDLSHFLEKKKQDKLIIQDPKNKNQMYILGSEKEFEELTSKYDETILLAFRNLMFYINNDLKYGIDKWEIFAEDEVIDVPGYPSFVTSEFIDEDKNDLQVKKKMKQKAIENVKNSYE